MTVFISGPAGITWGRGAGGMIVGTTGTSVLTCLSPDSVRVAL
jgi:hypothetical protein